MAKPGKLLVVVEVSTYFLYAIHRISVQISVTDVQDIVPDILADTCSDCMVYCRSFLQNINSTLETPGRAPQIGNGAG